MKKVLAILMVMVFCLGAFGSVEVPALAADYADAPLMPTVTTSPDAESLVVGDTEILASYAPYAMAVDSSNAETVETFAEVLSTLANSSVSEDQAKEIMDIIASLSSEETNVIVVEKSSVLSADAIKQTVKETGSGIAIVSINTNASTKNNAGDFVIVSISSSEAESLTKSVSMDIAVTTTQMSGSTTAIDIDKLSSSTEADTVVFDFSNTGNFGATMSVSSPVSMTVAKNADGSYPELSVFSKDGDLLGAVNLSGLASSVNGKITVPISISDSVVAKSTLNAFSIIGVKVAYASTQYAEVTGSVDASGNIEISNVTIVSDTFVPMIISVLTADELFVSATADAGDTTLSPGTTTTTTDDGNGISAWVWMIVAVAVLALVLVAVLVVKKKQA